MTVFDVVFRVRSDCSLERLDGAAGFRQSPNFFGNFDAWYQELSSEFYFRQQVNEHIIHCLRNQSLFCFFVWDRKGVLHLFNSRAEVRRFLKSQNDSMERFM